MSPEAEFLFGEILTADNDSRADFISLFSKLTVSDTPPVAGDLVFELRDTMTSIQLISWKFVSNYRFMERLNHCWCDMIWKLFILTNGEGLVSKRLICRIWGGNKFKEEHSEAFAQFNIFISGKVLHTPPHVTALFTKKERDIATNSPISSRPLLNDVAKQYSHEALKFERSTTKSLPKI